MTQFFKCKFPFYIPFFSQTSLKDIALQRDAMYSLHKSPRLGAFNGSTLFLCSYDFNQRSEFLFKMN